CECLYFIWIPFSLIICKLFSTEKCIIILHAVHSGRGPGILSVCCRILALFMPCRKGFAFKTRPQHIVLLVLTSLVFIYQPLFQVLDTHVTLYVLTSFLPY